MFQRIKIITAYIDILAFLVFGQRVMCFIWHYYSCGVKRRQHSGIVLAEKPQFVSLIRNFNFVLKIFLKSDNIETSILLETSY